MDKIVAVANIARACLGFLIEEFGLAGIITGVAFVAMVATFVIVLGSLDAQTQSLVAHATSITAGMR